DSSSEATGARTKVKIVKNKLAAPFKTAEFDINWNEGISRVGSILDVGTDLGILEKRGSWFAFEGEQLAQGRDAVKTLLQENHELEEKILNKIKEVIAERRAAAAGTSANAKTAPAAAEAPAEEK
ncbi:MAG: DNA recombination/repair protein RecA, partial [Lentisphaeria bacterium]|nr:DNA recombination/repair protein RecA [Lentisphaeria bacterium]